MCGIIGYAGHRPAVTVIIEGLKRLEYRGYDSAGVAMKKGDQLEVIRASGKLKELEAKLEKVNISQATAGVGHTRWATHGLPVERNAHPHTSNDGKIAMVHNGIIENYADLREKLKEKGHVFHSETDTEVLTHLISEGRKHHATMLEAMSWALAQVEGAYAVALVALDEPGVIYGARNSSPLVLGVGTGENFIASDIPAFLPYTRKVVFLEDGEIVRITDKEWGVFDAKTLAKNDKAEQHIDWDVQAARKGGFKHFMLKEIFEQPKVISDCLAGRIDLGRKIVEVPELKQFDPPKRLHIVACGTSFHAGLWGQSLLESWARIPTTVEIASEFRYRDVILDPADAVLVISQSGETADTLAGLRKVKGQGVSVIGLCNVVGSSIARESDLVVYTQAGPEISVASTKAMCSQLVLLMLMALHWGRQKGSLPENVMEKAVEGFNSLPGLLEAELPALRDKARKLARAYSDVSSFFYLGRGQSHSLALEGALKLKEISYIHAEGYAAGEMKHGPIALIDPDFPTFALAFSNDGLYSKVKSNLEEVQARDGKIIALTHPSMDLKVDDPWVIPEAWGPLSAFLALPALQLFAYEMADYLGKDVDQPRNLAKSVTVE